MHENTEFLNALSSGDKQALRKMRQALFPLVRKIVTGNGGTEEDAKDIFQEAALVIYDKLRMQPGFQLSGKFSPYFCAVCRNLWHNWRLKKSNSEVTISEDAKDLHSERFDLDYDDVERRQLFEKAFSGLGEDCQKLLRLFFQKISMQEIARQMGYASEGYARRRKCICKDQLIELIKTSPEFVELKSH